MANRQLEMWMVIGRSGGVCAFAKSKWKAKQIRDKLFNIGETDVVKMNVEFDWDYKRFIKAKSAKQRIEEIEKELKDLKKNLNV